VAAALAQREDHKIVAIARETGFDLLDGSGLEGALAGVEVVVDATQSPSLDEAESTGFFTTDAKNLRAVATRAGVSRTVVLSIVGVDRSPTTATTWASPPRRTPTEAPAPAPWSCVRRRSTTWPSRCSTPLRSATSAMVLDDGQGGAPAPVPLRHRLRALWLPISVLILCRGLHLQ
jgi:hypothetical protein